MRVPAIIANLWQRFGNLCQRFGGALFATIQALPHLGPIVLVCLLVWFAAGTGQVGDALGDSFSLFTVFTALAIVLFWGVLTASTWVLIKVALGDPKKEELLNDVRLLVSGVLCWGVITLPHYSAQAWWLVLALTLVVLTLVLVVSLSWNKLKKRRGSSNNRVLSKDEKEPVPPHRISRRPIVIAALLYLLFGVFLQVVQFYLDHGVPQSQFWFPWLLILSYMGFYYFIVAACILGVLWKRGQSEHVSGPKYIRTFLLASPFGLALTFLHAVGDPRVAHSFGIPALLLLTFGAWIILLTVAMFVSPKLGIPVLGALLLLGLLINLMPGASFQHPVRTYQNARDATKRVGEPSEFRDVYKDWLKARRGEQTADAKPYDVYIALAEGGGIRAAYQTALTLAYLEDLQPGFHKHVFAISGVSGGSVGAAVFSALCRLKDNGQFPQDKTWKDLVEDVFSRDLLAAPVGALIGREVFQYLWPCGWLGQSGVNYGIVLDRAIALETSLESAFFGSTGHNVLTDAFDFNPDKHAPLLLMNATEAPSGRRVVISPVLLKSDAVKSDAEKGDAEKALYPLTEKGAPQLQMSTAALISARFPLISPTARLSLGDGKRISIVDGEGSPRCNENSTRYHRIRPRIAIQDLSDHPTI